MTVNLPEVVSAVPWYFCVIRQHAECAYKAELQRGVMNVCPCDCHRGDPTPSDSNSERGSDDTDL